MEGIVGILASSGSVSKTALERATDSLAHRGPDDKGTVVIQAGRSSRLEMGVGSRRLAVLDLSPSGRQPMEDAETGNWIVYEGETTTSAKSGRDCKARARALTASPIPRCC